MLSIKPGNKFFSRLVSLCDGKVSPERISLLSDEEIKGVGTASSKVTFIRAITEAVSTKELNFNELYQMSDTDVFNKFTAIGGIGKWTANMYLVFVLNRQDILPINDAIFLQAYAYLYKIEDRSKNKSGKNIKNAVLILQSPPDVFIKCLISDLPKKSFIFIVEYHFNVIFI